MQKVLSFIDVRNYIPKVSLAQLTKYKVNKNNGNKRSEMGSKRAQAISPEKLKLSGNTKRGRILFHKKKQANVLSNTKSLSL